MEKINKEFYKKTLREDRQYSYKVIAKYIKRIAFPDIQTVVEYGSGSSWFLKYLQDYGVTDICGIEPNREAAQITHENVKPYIVHRSLARNIDLSRRFDLALCIEVAEHINPKFANLVIKNITRHSDLVIFSAATPGQGGVGHINEQPFEYWEEKFMDNGFECDNKETAKFRLFLNAKISKSGHRIKKWYVHNIAVFKKA